MIIQASTYVSFESSATVEPQQRSSNIYIYLYVSDQSVFIGSEDLVTLFRGYMEGMKRMVLLARKVTVI